MGCLNSSNQDGDDDENAIPVQMKNTYLSSSCDFWNQVEDLLSDCENLREGLEDNHDKMMDIADADKLVDGTLVDAVNGWLWCMSSIVQGNIFKWGLNLAISEPYLRLDKKNKSSDVIEFAEILESYVKTVVEAPSSIKQITQDLKKSLSKAVEMKDQLPGEIKNNSLNPLEEIKVIPNFASNVMTLEKALTKISRFDEVLSKAMIDVKDLVQNFPTMVSEAGEIGKKCDADGYKKPDDCLLHNVPKERIEESEQKKLEKADKKKKKKLKKQKKKEKKEAWLKSRGKL